MLEPKKSRMVCPKCKFEIGIKEHFNHTLYCHMCGTEMEETN
jgi:hypothetical protein